MAANLSTIQSIENHEKWSQLYKILAEAHPQNQSIQTELGKLSNNKETHLSQLKKAWESKPIPLYDQADIKRLCTAYYAREAADQVQDEMQERIVATSSSKTPRNGEATTRKMGITMKSQSDLTEICHFQKFISH